jgi:hypothetical protein
MKLIIEDDDGLKTVVTIVRDEITIGRQEGNTIRLTERNVSRRHARLVKENGNLLIEDLGSYNGVRVNGEKITEKTKIKEGDLVEIGDYDLGIQGKFDANVPGSVAKQTTLPPGTVRAPAAAKPATASRRSSAAGLHAQLQRERRHRHHPRQRHHEVGAAGRGARPRAHGDASARRDCRAVPRQGVLPHADRGEVRPHRR